MQTITCLCLLMVLMLSVMEVQGVAQQKVSTGRSHKLRTKLAVSDKAKRTVSTSARALKRGLVSPAPTTLLQQSIKAKTLIKQDPVVATDTTVGNDAWATSPTSVIATPLTEPSTELKDDASLTQILQAYTDVEGRVDQLEEGRRDAAWNRADIASAQGQAVRLIQSAQEAVANEQAQQKAMSILEISADKDSKDTKEETKDTLKTNTAVEAATEVEVEEDPSTCCTNAKDEAARAAAAANTQSISDMQAQIVALNSELTKAIAPPNLDPEAFNQENSAVIGDSGVVNIGGTGVTSQPTSTGSAAECNTHLNKDTMKGDPNIWKEEEQAKKDALNKLLEKIGGQMTTGMAVDDPTLTKTRNMLTDNDAKSKDVKIQLAKSCAEPTCALGAGGGLVVEADTTSSA